MRPHKALLILLGVLISISVSGCSWCTKIVYVDVPVPFNVPVKCKVPQTTCHVDGTDAEVVVGLTQCIFDLKKAQEVCK